MPIERTAVVCNEQGLHFRPIMRLVDTASRFESQITVRVEDRQADARSPMALLMLVATKGTQLRFVGEGADAEQALDAIVRLVDSGFDEM